MKRLVCAILALSVLGASAAEAAPYNHGYGGHSYGGHGGGYSRQYGSDYGHGWHRGGDGAALIGLGLGIIALSAIAADRDHDRYDDRYAPPPDYRGNRYDNSRGHYDDGYGDR